MNKYYYKKAKISSKRIIRISGLGIAVLGFLLVLYIFFPLISWHIYFAPAYATSMLAAPIPKTTIVNSTTFGSLLKTSKESLGGIDYTNAQNWFPNYKAANKKHSEISYYSLSIPQLRIQNATVATTDYDLSKHLVHYGNTPIPPQNGNTVIFGHSTLPQLFNQKDYKTIFATLYKLKIGDEFTVDVSGITYLYKVHDIAVVEPNDTSAFSQALDASYITLVTCTPPGTTWKRLIVKARLIRI